eukprot:Tbor_TRINITY_DN5552_c0_g4::TRINITY_DN5552_c0_g4_i1::g.13178::m.13178
MLPISRSICICNVIHGKALSTLYCDKNIIKTSFSSPAVYITITKGMHSNQQRYQSSMGGGQGSSGCLSPVSHPVTFSLVRPDALGSVGPDGRGIEFRSDEWRRAMLCIYRVIRKLHAVKLLPVQQELGDKFLRAEFQRHKMTNEKFAKLFYMSWWQYAAQLEAGITNKEMSDEEKALLNDDQRSRMTDLRRHVVEIKQKSGDFIL